MHETKIIQGLKKKYPGLMFRHDTSWRITALRIVNQKIIDINWIEDFREISYLELYSNRISDISALKHLKKLKFLDLSSNLISDVSPLGELELLEHIKVKNNEISDISSFRSLYNLKQLDLSFNKIFDISVISNLSELQELNLSNNQVWNLLPLLSLKKLKSLNLIENHIEEIPDETFESNLELDFSQEGQIDKISVFGNPVQVPPPEILSKGYQEVKEYFLALKGDRKALNELKVILVGDGGAGKTSLVKNFIGKQFEPNEPQTQGINISKWKTNYKERDYFINLWDFGGQEIMHATHQFFLSRRSLYLLVLDGRRDEKTEYWLKSIESFGGSSPVIIVMNKLDENPSFDLNRKFLKEKYKNILGFFKVSCKSGLGLELLANSLKEVFSSVDLIKTTWPKPWFRIKEKLESLEKPFISIEQYRELCDDEKIFKSIRQDTLIGFLHDLGIILHFNDYELLGTQVLEPLWVTKAVYKIINSPIVSKNNGMLNLGDLHYILKPKNNSDFSYPKEKHLFIVNLMKKFELCYQINGEDYLIPDLLPIDESEFKFDETECIRFFIDYNFLPRSVITRFIVNMNENVKENLLWRTGVILEDINLKSIAIIKVDYEERRIVITVNGDQRRDFFTTILYKLRLINNSFEKLKVGEFIPMPDNKEIVISYGHLIRLAKNGIKDYMPDGSDESYNIDELLGFITKKDTSEEEIMQILKKLLEKSDTQESLLKKANDIVLLQPNIAGIGINLNSAIAKLFQRKEPKNT